MDDAARTSAGKKSSISLSPQRARRLHDNGKLHISLKQWRVLHAVHDCGSFVEAAMRVHLSQPAISYTIAQLQEQLGVEVYKLAGRKAILTDAGRKMLDLSRSLLQEATALEEYAKSLSSQAQAGVRLRIEATFPNELVEPVINAFPEMAPRARLFVINAGSAPRASSLLSELDSLVAITARKCPGYVQEHLVDLHFVPVCSANDPILARPDLTLNELRSALQFVVGDSAGDEGRRGYGGLESKSSRLVPNYRSAVEGIREEGGFAWLPYWLARKWHAQLALHILRPRGTGPIRRRTFYLAYKSERVGDSAMMLLIRALKAEFPVSAA